MELLHDTPDPSSFVSLAEHQSATPESFFAGPPVLHLHCPAASLRLSRPTAPALAKLAGLEGPTTNGGPHAGPSELAPSTATEEEVTVPSIKVYVLSSALLLHRPAPNTTLRVPYPSIGLHAIAGDGVYLQISTAGPDARAFDDHDPDASTEVTILPGTVEGHVPAVGGQSEPSPVQALYAALSACANLHPDPPQDGEEDGDEEMEGGGGGQPAFSVLGDGMPPPVSGSGGWITADNMGEFFDEEGNWKGEGEEPRLGMGPGAGTVRAREGDGVERADAGEEKEDETKWQRTG